MCSNNKTLAIVSSCTSLPENEIRNLALVRGLVSIVCFCLCLVTFVLELFHICSKRNSTTLQRFFIYLTVSTLLYTGALSLQIKHPFDYAHGWQCEVFCTVIGLLNQYTGSVQLLVILGMIVKLFHTISSLCCTSNRLFVEFIRHHQCKIEALFVVLCFSLPCIVIWIPFTMDDGSYGGYGPWCWINILKEDCNASMKGIVEVTLFWYIPFALVSALSLIITVEIAIFLLYVSSCHKIIRNKVRAVMTEMLFLLPFLFIFCCLCIAELVVMVRLQHVKDYYESIHIMWIFSAFSAPVGGIVISTPLFLYFFKMRNRSPASGQLNISDIHTVKPSTRISVASYTSQQERPNFLSRSHEEYFEIPAKDGAEQSRQPETTYGATADFFMK